MKNFFESIPVSVEEQARIDGAGTFRIFWSVVLPMARPALITIVILSFQGSWNELSHFIVSTQSPELTTLTKGVASLAGGQLSQGTQYPLKLAAALIMTIPVAVMFFIFQKRIMNTRRVRSRNERVSDSPSIRASRCSTTPWSRCGRRRRCGPPTSGDLGSRAITGCTTATRVRSGSSRCTYGGGRPGVDLGRAAHRLARRLRRHAACGRRRACPIRRCASSALEWSATARSSDTLTITSHVADPVSTEVRLRLVPEFAPLQEVKAGLAAAARVEARAATTPTGDVRVASGARVVHRSPHPGP